MPKVSEQVLIPHSAENLYELVRDIRRYPEFIKWIRAVSVADEKASSEGHYSCLGEANVYFKGFDERFATHVQADPHARRIDVNLARGPFRHLRNRWQFDPREDGKTRVHCFIDYEFKNPVLSLLARTNSRLAVELIIDAFRAEADRRFI
ncbi:MAG: type II toxin-antitoxin system RatA family toxin [Hyphomonas sp.]|jgi:coenzyme Q-binding protein COQ10|nr:type II toxin-antitoxin system RatA family toxin [Henriciella sp.]MBO6696346.1 type II toxin-antitoxin system RatA family toxin [Henriciella sp.]MCH9752541.1 type II toxin-antitoxin system RatA family toxin [Alphaproteobacteria bacterium]MCR9223541.1 type II toxin-antitoxin system RatA family toxin [Hyphomonas sp.]